MTEQHDLAELQARLAVLERAFARLLAALERNGGIWPGVAGSTLDLRPLLPTSPGDRRPLEVLAILDAARSALERGE